MHKRKLPKKIVIRTRLLNFINNLKSRLYVAYFSTCWSSCFCPKLRKGHFVQNLVVLNANLESSKTIDSEAFRTILLQGHNQFYGVITFSQRYKQTVYLGKIFWTQFDCMTNKKSNSLGIKIYGKYQWIKKFDKHLYPMLYTSYAIKKIYKNFAWLFLLIELVKMSQKREKLNIKTLTFEHKNNCLQKIKKGPSKVALC